MNFSRIVVASFTLLLPLAGVAQSSMQPASLSSGDARRLVMTAHSATQYMQLAKYFHQQELGYRTKAADEKIEWDRRALVNASTYQKFPRPVDSARNLYDYYSQCANSAALKASLYDHLGSGETINQ
jgi:hypothetical protein